MLQILQNSYIRKSDIDDTDLEKNERIFFTKIAFEDGISTKGLQDWAKKEELLSPRRTISLLQDMKKKGMIKQAKIKGYKKRWIINEEKTGDFVDLWVTLDYTTKKERVQFTQAELTKAIKFSIKDYEKRITNKKSDINQKFPFGDIIYIVHALSLIARLTLAINSGYFINAKVKTTHAQENIKLLEKFLQKLCYNMAKKDEKSYGMLIALIYDYFGELNPFENLHTFEEIPIPAKKQIPIRLKKQLPS